MQNHDDEKPIPKSNWHYTFTFLYIGECQITMSSYCIEHKVILFFRIYNPNRKFLVDKNIP